jgi:hypothetical protein
MRSLPLVILATVVLGGTAHAETLRLSAGAPSAGLPAVSADGNRYARPVHVQPADCKGAQIFVEMGPVRTDGSELLLVKDDCSSSSATLAAKNLEMVNKQLAEGKYRSVGKTIGRPLGNDLDVDGRKVSIAAGSGNAVIVSTGKRDRWDVRLEGKPIEVRGWYGVKSGGQAYLSIAVAVSGKDLGPRGRERWLDFKPDEDSSAAEGSPTEVAERFLAALRKKDAREIEELISTPFWKVGLTPVGNKACKRKQSASRTKQVRAVAACIAGGPSQVYAKYTSPDTLSEIELAELPDELRKHRRKVAKLLRGGDKLVRYYVADDDLYVTLILVLDADTDYQTVHAALEYIDAGNATENY